MNPFVELRTLLANPTDRGLGQVVQVTGSSVKVFVEGKMKSLPNAQNLDLKTGDRVSLQGDVVIGKAYRPATVQTYYV